MLWLMSEYSNEFEYSKELQPRESSPLSRRLTFFFVASPAKQEARSFSIVRGVSYMYTISEKIKSALSRRLSSLE